MEEEKLRDFRDFATRVNECRRPEDFFGELPATANDAFEVIRKTMVPLYTRYHPCRSTRGSFEILDLAHEIMGALEVLRNGAEKKLADGTYGQPDIPEHQEPLFEINAGEMVYRVMRHIGEGDISKVYAAEFDGTGGIEAVCIKICEDPENDPLLIREAEFLAGFEHKQVPRFIGSFVTKEGKQAIAMQLIDGFDMVALRHMPMYYEGIPSSHACWMLERSLSVLGNIHANAATLHGDITPWHLMVRPFDHRVFLVDFTYSVKDGGKYCLPATEIYGAPEISGKAKPSPEADIFALGQSIIYLLGGYPETNYIPETVDRRIANILHDMTNPDPEKRNPNAWGLARRLSDLRLKIFGDRHGFIPFATEQAL